MSILMKRFLKGKLMASNWRNSKLYHIWRKYALKKNPYCIICGRSDQLHVHHINDASTHPMQRYLPTNAAVLCNGCHFRFHIYYMQGYDKPCTAKDLSGYIKLINSLKEQPWLNNMKQN